LSGLSIALVGNSENEFSLRAQPARGKDFPTIRNSEENRLEENMQSDGNKIFVGIKIGDKLRDQLEASNASMKPFFAGNNPEYLQVMQIDDDDYIGKVAASGASLEALSNMFMNVKTMLKMICPAFILADGAIKIFALTPTPVRTYH
jgi:hypothetical protein